MVKALLFIHRSLFPLKQDSPGTVNGRTLRFVKAPLPTTPQGSAPRVPLQGVPPARDAGDVLQSARDGEGIAGCKAHHRAGLPPTGSGFQKAIPPFEAG